MKFELETTYEGYPKELLEPVKSKLKLSQCKYMSGRYILGNYEARFDDDGYTYKRLDLILEEKYLFVRKICSSCGAEFQNELNYPECEVVVKSGAVGFGAYTDENPNDFAVCAPYLKRKKESDAYKERAIEESKRLERIKKCPVCGATLEKAGEYDPLSSVNDRNRKSRDGRIKNFTHKCETVKGGLVPSREVVSEIKSDPKKLKQYILHLISLESEIYATTKRLSSLYFNQFEFNRNATFARHYPVYKRRLDLQKVDKRIDSLNGELREQRKQRTAIENAEVLDAFAKYPVVPVAPEAPVLQKPGLFNKKKVNAENAAKEQTYQQALKKHEADLCAYHEEVESVRKGNEEIRMNAVARIDASIEAIEDKILLEKHIRSENLAKIDAMVAEQDKAVHPAFTAKASIDNEIQMAEELLQNLYKCRKKLYSINVVFEKYRNVVALSTFYEYLMAGRCNGLEGADGAYNLYEAEIRADRIIDQLSTIIESLEDIKKNQYMIYSKLQSINKSLSSIDYSTSEMLKSVQKIAGNSDIIAENSAITAHNTAVTAFYAKKNAELTKALGYLVALQ